MLAYRIIAWAIEQGGVDVRVAVQGVFAAASTHVGFRPLPDDVLDLRAHGILARPERHELALAAIRDVVAPAGCALVGATKASVEERLS